MTTPTIIVGIDGSPGADYALHWAQAVAARTGAPIRAVLAWDLPVYIFATRFPNVETPPIPAVKAAAQSSLDAALERVKDGAGAITPVLRQGPAASTLLAEAEEHDAALVVVGTRGLGPVRRILMGSVSTRVARDASCPVAIVPPGAPDPSGPVVVGVDGSAGSIAALRWAAATTDRQIFAVHVMEYPFGPEYVVEGLVFDDHESFGREVAERTVNEAIGARADLSIEVVSGDARDVLNHVAATRSATVIVVGARGGKGLAGLGSVATSVASNADVAVVVVPVT
jgi:nucleotide-binding universal stress UspA family protein